MHNQLIIFFLHKYIFLTKITDICYPFLYTNMYTGKICSSLILQVGIHGNSKKTPLCLHQGGFALRLRLHYSEEKKQLLQVNAG